MRPPELIYRAPEPADPDTVLCALRRGDAARAAEALIGHVLVSRDLEATQELCLALITNPHIEVAYAAALSLGQLARLHRHLDEQRALAALETVRKRPGMRIAVETAMEDIAWFLHGQEPD